MIATVAPASAAAVAARWPARPAPMIRTSCAGMGSILPRRRGGTGSPCGGWPEPASGHPLRGAERDRRAAFGAGIRQAVGAVDRVDREPDGEVRGGPGELPVVGEVPPPAPVADPRGEEALALAQRPAEGRRPAE